MSLVIRPEHPMDASLVEVLRSSARITTAAGVPMTLVGALARDVVLTHVHGISLKRATTDIDVALAVRGWQGFEELRRRLLDDVRFESSNSPNRLYFQRTGGTPLPLDLVPYGPGIGLTTFTWPSDPHTEMNVSGYIDAAAHPETVRLADDLEIEVVSLAGLAILKLYAWMDRRRETRRDAEDLAALLRHYVDAGNFHRLYRDHIKILETVGYDQDRAASFLLGHDMAAIASKQARHDLRTILSDRDTVEALAIAMSRSAGPDREALERAMERLEDLGSGFTHNCAPRT